MVAIAQFFHFGMRERIGFPLVSWHLAKFSRIIGKRTVGLDLLLVSRLAEHLDTGAILVAPGDSIEDSTAFIRPADLLLCVLLVCLNVW